MKEIKSFKEYAQCLRELPAHVEASLFEKELTSMFMDTMQSPFFVNMIGSGAFGFVESITIGERFD